MEQYEFWKEMEDRIQNMTLMNPDELREIASHRRGMERDEHKSYLREKEYENKQLVKIRNSRIFEDEKCIFSSTVNGKGMLIQNELLFACKVECMRRYKRYGTDTHQWQVVLREYYGGGKVESPLYDEAVIGSMKKFQATIFAKYEQASTEKGRVLAWRWLRMRLIAAYEQAEVINIPSQAGWHEDEGKWHFWTCLDEEMLLNDQMKRFSHTFLNALSINDVTNSLIENTSKIADDKTVGILLIFRLIALLGRLSTDQPLCAGMTLVGEMSEPIAKAYLRTMHNNVDIANIDSDRIGTVRNRANLLKDTPLILVSSSPDNRSVQNRIREVMGWMSSGYIEGKTVTIPYVFCIRKFSKTYPLDETVVLDTRKISAFEENLSFAKLQSWMINTIEKSGNFWVDELREVFAKYFQRNADGNRIMPMTEAVVSVVLKVFDAEKIGEATHGKLFELFQAGKNEIERQFSRRGNLLLDLFKKAVIKQIETGKVIAIARNETVFLLGEKVVFFDSENYYFTNDTMTFICQQAEIDDKSILSIKQQLAEQGFLKTYNSSVRELESDFYVKKLNGQSGRCSGLAIKKTFWDEFGEIALHERRRINAEAEM